MDERAEAREMARDSCLYMYNIHTEKMFQTYRFTINIFLVRFFVFYNNSFVLLKKKKMNNYYIFYCMYKRKKNLICEASYRYDR